MRQSLSTEKGRFCHKEHRVHRGNLFDLCELWGFFNPNVFPSLASSLRDWVQQHASCLEMDMVEEFMVHNFFGYGYLRDIWFTGIVDDPELPGNYGSISNFGFDAVMGDRRPRSSRGAVVSRQRLAVRLVKMF